jgi:branched-chain amino acid transport system substrate-binding protein
VKFPHCLQRLAACVAPALLAHGAWAAPAGPPLKIGFVAPMSGEGAEFGQRIYNGVRAYIKEHGDTVAGRKVEVIVRDTTGPLPEMARRYSQELVARDKVEFLAGYAYTPEALGGAPIATQSKTPMIVMNASASAVVQKSPYIARVSFTEGQLTAPLAEWAARNGIKTAYTMVSDYAPGIDAEKVFGKVFVAAGGTIAGGVRMPLTNPDFSPFVERMKAAKPAAVFFFAPGGDAVLGFLKAFSERGLGGAGVKVLMASQVPDETLQAMGANGHYVTIASQYLLMRNLAQNTSFRKAYAAVAGPDDLPTQYSVAGYDGMAAIYNVATKLNGRIDGDAAMAALKGMNIDSPRGPITIGANRDIVQTIYIGSVKRAGNRNELVEIAHFDQVTDPEK